MTRHARTGARPTRLAARLGAGLGALALAAGLVVAAAPAASALAVDTNAWYQVVSRHSGKAIDVAGASTADGAAIHQWSRHSGTNQHFQFVDAGGGYYRIKARHSGKVIDIANASTTTGADVIQSTDNGGTSQQFRVVDTDSGYAKLVNRNSGMPLDLWAWSTADGARISQYADSGGANQQWQLIQVDGGGGQGGITWSLARAPNPTPDQQQAYGLITTAMNAAVARYNLSSLSKTITVHYDPSVPTANGNINGTIRFGSRASMNERTALHEISHTLGVGTSSRWRALGCGGTYTGAQATALLRQFDGQSAVITCDNQHFWPYGLNFDSEFSQTSADRHVDLVEAMVRDGL